jgi:hypothetical protein
MAYRLGVHIHGFSVERGFWERYAAIGRCAIDVGHVMTFRGDHGRWVTNGSGGRICSWCGQALEGG